MTKENRDEKIQKATALLNNEESHAFSLFCATQEPNLAPSLNARLYNLFLQGRSCAEIQAQNRPLSLGQVVSARIEGEWDRRRSEHLDSLLTNTTLRVQQGTLETADFVLDLLAVMKVEHGAKLRQYLQSGDKSDLGDFKIDSLSNLKSTIEILQKLTGQDKKQQLNVTGEITHKDKTAGNSAPTSDEAQRILKLLMGK